MGNVPPLEVGVRESPEVVAHWAKSCLDKAAPGGGLILSVGGGVSPDMPAENIDAMLETAQTWKESDAPAPVSVGENTSAATPKKSKRRPRPRRS